MFLFVCCLVLPLLLWKWPGADAPMMEAKAPNGPNVLGQDARHTSHNIQICILYILNIIYYLFITLCKNPPTILKLKNRPSTDRITRTSWWTSSEALELIPNLPSVARVELLVKGCGGDR